MQKAHKHTMPVIATLLLVLLWAPASHADSDYLRSPGPHKRQSRLDLTGSVSMDVIGGAAWYIQPVIEDGFITGINNSVDVEMGSYLFWGTKGSYLAVQPTIGARWNFHVSPEWTVFAGPKVGLLVGLGEDILELLPAGSTGACWHIGSGMDLRIEFGFPFLIQLGVSNPL